MDFEILRHGARKSPNLAGNTECSARPLPQVCSLTLASSFLRVYRIGTSNLTRSMRVTDGTRLGEM